MGVIESVKALLALRHAVTKMQEAYVMNSTPVKPGWKTTEFWGKIAVQVFSLLGAVQGFLPASTAGLIIGVLEGVYTIARSVVKAKGGTLPDVPIPAQ